MTYEKECAKVKKANMKYLEIFRSALKEKGLTEKTIGQHFGNVEFFLNDFNMYEEADTMVDGCRKLNSYFGDFFIRKCMWSTPATIKSTAASIKKFYKCMLEHDEIDNDDYESVCETIKEDLEDWVKECKQYNNNEGEFDMFYF